MPRSWTTPGTAGLLKGIFQMRGEIYVREGYLLLLDLYDKTPSLQDYKKPSYGSIRKMFYLLRRLGLIEFTREESPTVPKLIAGEMVQKKGGGFNRRYHRIVPGMENDPGWRDPQRALYHPEEFEEATEFRLRFTFPEDWMERIRTKRRTR